MLGRARVSNLPFEPSQPSPFGALSKRIQVKELEEAVEKMKSQMDEARRQRRQSGALSVPAHEGESPGPGSSQAFSRLQDHRGDREFRAKSRESTRVHESPRERKDGGLKKLEQSLQDKETEMAQVECPEAREVHRSSARLRRT